MKTTSSGLTNPYASPAADETTEAVAALVQLPLSREIWWASVLIWLSCLGLGLAAGYVLLAWLVHTYPQMNVRLHDADRLAPFATGAANAVVMAALLGYGQYYAVIRRDMIWTRTIALLLIIASLVIALGSVLIFSGTAIMWFLLIPAVTSAVLSGLMFRWYARLSAFRRQQRRTLRVTKNV
ncbi:hypothetical protein ETAA8_37410 [Anatilimnocola aggregata]|uniref:Uncharacterized protein n=1 Tax=Anatilimnocola aggregata TaxID=2528021 RepID=A0A517YEJ6_9BACT|nr:hypothetical protein [Anatilimnocola aggregata]QDU28638.1 hypothetical protein ETAA8_37410 [Anatilimnocola aggregata]